LLANIFHSLTAASITTSGFSVSKNSLTAS